MEKKKSVLEILKGELQAYIEDDHLPSKIEVREGSELATSLSGETKIEGIPIEITPNDGQDYTFVFDKCRKPLVTFKHLNRAGQEKVKQEMTDGYRTPEYAPTR